MPQVSKNLRNNNLTVVKRNDQIRAKLLGICFERRLNSDFYVNASIKKLGKKSQALKRVWNYMNLNRRRSIINAFIISQFSIGLLV